MKQQNKFSLTNRLKSFKYALQGIALLFKTEHNAWIHLGATIFVISLGSFFYLTVTEWCLTLFAIGFVFITEILNTSIEYLTDLVSPTYHEKAKKVKDLAAAAVLVASIVAIIIGLFVFLPKMI